MAAERIGDILQRILPERLLNENSTYTVNDLVLDADGKCVCASTFYGRTAAEAIQKARELRRAPPREKGGAIRAIGVYRRKKLLKYWEIRLGDEPCKAANPPSAS